MNTKTTITQDILNNLDIDFLNEIPCFYLIKDKYEPIINISDMEHVRKLLKYLDKRRLETTEDL